METNLFYITHLAMFICAATIVCTVCLENIQAWAIKLLNLASGISPLKKLKAIYRSLVKESISIKSLIVSVLNIGTQISNQLLK